MIRVCTECGKRFNALTDTALTCSDAHRSARSRRLKRAEREHADNPDLKRAQDALQATDPRDVARTVMEEELRPYVREQITDDVVKAIGGMMTLTPAVVEVLKRDLTHEDPNVRKYAATLITRYTMSDKLLDRDTPTDRHLNVNIGVPAPATQEQVAADATTLRTCDICATSKPPEDFVGSSARCTECYEDRRRQTNERYGIDQDGD